MIIADATGGRSAFETLLQATSDSLREAIRIAPSMDNIEFEDSVFRAMKEKAIGTPFENTISKTERGAFPDIVANQIYGVEVKQVQKQSSRTRGNSIFESTRTKGLEEIYLMMCWDAAKGAQISWCKYQDAVAGVVITHSPRYLLDANLSEGDSLFDKINVDYDTFRKMTQAEMMDYVRGLYQTDESSKDLWWLETRDRKPLRLLEAFDDNDAEAHKLTGEAFFLCPQVFGDDNKRKYAAVVAYWLSQGIVSQVVRDKFSSGGRKNIGSVEVTQVLYRSAVKRKQNILDAADSVDDEVICQFWGVDTPPPHDKRIQHWLLLVRQFYKGNQTELQAFENAFEDVG